MKNDRFRYYLSLAGFKEHLVKEKVSDRVTKKSKYKDWDLDSVLTQSFVTCWETHSHLFTDERLEENSGEKPQHTNFMNLFNR